MAPKKITLGEGTQTINEKLEVLRIKINEIIEYLEDEKKEK